MPTTPVSDYRNAQGLHSVSASNIISVIRAANQQVGTSILGLTPKEVGKQSLRSGGVTAMHITGVPDGTLIDIGWWRLIGFMVCIQHQISNNLGFGTSEQSAGQ